MTRKSRRTASRPRVPQALARRALALVVTEPYLCNSGRIVEALAVTREARARGLLPPNPRALWPNIAGGARRD